MIIVRSSNIGKYLTKEEKGRLHLLKRRLAGVAERNEKAKTYLKYLDECDVLRTSSSSFLSSLKTCIRFNAITLFRLIISEGYLLACNFVFRA
ncbi:MAG: hypothetical protein AOA65_1679 [Candidatus Bathyarchaeota archaeon BA1]|nr:MAG: hypothetical protein AOA65_1679 [Candidatus Bathyarchaeota archaeon BA1]